MAEQLPPTAYEQALARVTANLQAQAANPPPTSGEAPRGQ
jgi:hypothetical protein